MKAFIAALLIIFLCGCGLIPKKVEFFQKKVKAIPEKTEKAVEMEKQAAQIISKKASQAYIAAVREDSSTNVVFPLWDIFMISPILSESLGPPKSPYKGNVTNLAQNIQKSIATLDQKLDDAREDNKPLEGKKIEGTGVVQMSYFTYLFIVLGSLFVIYKVISVGFKIYGTMNPVVGLGVNALKVPAEQVKKALLETIEGGERFKKEVEELISDENLRDAIVKIFRNSQEVKQSRDTQKLIKDLTRKD